MEDVGLRIQSGISPQALERFDLEPGLVERLREDDDELLRFGFRWLRLALFGEPILKVKDPANLPNLPNSPNSPNSPRRTA